MINIIRAFNNKIGLHLQGYNWNLTPITNVIWWVEIQTPMRFHPSFLKYMAMIFLLNNTRLTHFKGKMNWNCKVRFYYYQPSPNFVAKSIVEINPSCIRWPKSGVKAFSCHAYGDQKNLVATRLATECFPLPQDWWPKLFNCHTNGDW